MTLRGPPDQLQPPSTERPRTGPRDLHIPSLASEAPKSLLGLEDNGTTSKQATRWGAALHTRWGASLPPDTSHSPYSHQGNGSPESRGISAQPRPLVPKPNPDPCLTPSQVTTAPGPGLGVTPTSPPSSPLSLTLSHHVWSSQSTQLPPLRPASPLHGRLPPRALLACSLPWPQARPNRAAEGVHSKHFMGAPSVSEWPEAVVICGPREQATPGAPMPAFCTCTRNLACCAPVPDSRRGPVTCSGLWGQAAILQPWAPAPGSRGKATCTSRSTAPAPGGLPAARTSPQ